MTHTLMRRARMKKERSYMTTAFGAIENAITAVKKGASHYISKPFRIGDVLTVIKRVLEEAKFEEGVRRLKMDHTLSTLANAIRRRIIWFLHERGHMRLMEITKELNIEDHTKVVFHLRFLKESGLVTQDDWRSYLLTKKGKRVYDS